mmetsp:Transcript_18138/g.30301  ORF Transcript_18138/g.30301 Transcript_18138/m.30301 type:complete len:1081 (+) Transcript_18138:3-3245(+)
MGCCGSSEEEVTAAPELEADPAPVRPEGDAVTHEMQLADGQKMEMSEVRLQLAAAETNEVAPEHTTFLASVLKARKEYSDDAEIMIDSCKRLQLHNRELKNFVAMADAQAVHEAMNGGFLGNGTNDRKLIAVLCSRTKSQLKRTKKAFFQLYDEDIRKAVKGETGGDYGRMMYYAMQSQSEFIADVIDEACGGLGCDESMLVDLFVMFGQEHLYAGKVAWEGRTDRSLIDYLNSELGIMYKNLRLLILMLLKDVRDEGEEVDEAYCEEAVETLKGECDKGILDAVVGEGFDSNEISELIGKNNIPTNRRIAVLFENKYNKSLVRALDGKCGKRFHATLSGLLLPRPDFIAMRLEAAMKGWTTDKRLLVRLLGGLDGESMIGVNLAYERKYSRPLPHAIRKEISGEGHFELAALVWLKALEEPSRGAETLTEVEVDKHEGDTEALARMLDMLLVENDSLLAFISYLDVETLREAVKGWSVDDTQLIRTLATRSKRFLARVSVGYRKAFQEPLHLLVDEQLSGYYAYLAKFLVVQEAQADSMLLDHALQTPGDADKKALVEFLCARHPRRVRAVKKKWEAANDESLIDKLNDELEGDMRRIALTLLKGKRETDDDDVDADSAVAEEQAATLLDDPSKGIEILCSNSPKQNKALSLVFEDKNDTSLGRHLGSEYSGYVKNALLALLQGQHDWYAASLRAAFRGTGAADKTVCRILGAHDKKDVQLIAKAYEKKYDVTLKSELSRVCKGDYKRLAIAWLELPDQLEQPRHKISLPAVEPEPELEPSPVDEEDPDDEELDDDDENLDNIPSPDSPLYKAKVRKWKRKLEEAESKGKIYKAQYYRRLLMLHPPLPQGNELLAAYKEALTAEYQDGTSGMVQDWLDSVEESEIGDDEGETKSKAVFAEWVQTTQVMIEQKTVTIRECTNYWGLNARKTVEESLKPAKYFEPQYEPEYVVATPEATPEPVLGVAVQEPAAAAPPGTQQLSATVPYGVYGGQTMTITTPSGQVLAVQVPMGLAPGSTFVFQAPLNAPPAAPPPPIIQPTMYQQPAIYQQPVMYQQPVIYQQQPQVVMHGTQNPYYGGWY